MITVIYIYVEFALNPYMNQHSLIRHWYCAYCIRA